IAGVNWVTGHAVKPAVANMSLGGGYSASMNAALQASIASGVTYVVAAGNSADNACVYSPSSTPEAITVGSSDQDDKRSSFSHTGTCVDLSAPGSSIVSDGRTADDATATLSGTSMAAPHVTGTAALWLQDHPGDSPATVADQVVGSGSVGKLSG